MKIIWIGETKATRSNPWKQRAAAPSPSPARANPSASTFAWPLLAFFPSSESTRRSADFPPGRRSRWRNPGRFADLWLVAKAFRRLAGNYWKGDQSRLAALHRCRRLADRLPDSSASRRLLAVHALGENAPR